MITYFVLWCYLLIQGMAQIHRSSAFSKRRGITAGQHRRPLVLSPHRQPRVYSRDQFPEHPLPQTYRAPRPDHVNLTPLCRPVRTERATRSRACTPARHQTLGTLPPLPCTVTHRADRAMHHFSCNGSEPARFLVKPASHQCPKPAPCTQCTTPPQRTTHDA
jgi:hypothetical protein